MYILKVIHINSKSYVKIYAHSIHIYVQYVVLNKAVTYKVKDVSLLRKIIHTFETVKYNNKYYAEYFNSICYYVE
jgi:hypothetical protein